MVNGECLGDLGAPQVKGSVSLMMNEGTRIGTICEERDASPLTGAPDPAGATGRSGAPRPAPHLTHRPRPESRPAARRYRRVALAWAALAVLAVLATVAPEQAAAQTVTTFLSNTGQTVSLTSSQLRATAFTTGTGTYTLSSVAISVSNQNSTPTPVVQIYTGTSTTPGTLVATMSNPTLVSNAVNIFTAPANTTLAASTTYWVTTSNSAASNGTGFRVTVRNGTDLDSGTAAGWSIGNALWRTSNANAWDSSGNRIQLQIRGTAQTTTPTPTNATPTVANAIPDQTATAGTGFSYQFPTNTFNDTDTGDTLSYTATKPDDTDLPTWLSFDAATRTFKGTPAATDVETVSVKVTANDSNGGLVSDVFDIVVEADTTPPTLTDAGVNRAGEDMTLTFSEDLQEFTLPPASAFTVTADGSAVTVSIGIHHSPFLDTFSILVSPFIRQGQTVVVTYTDPSTGDDTNAIQDTSGNDAASFTTDVSGVPAVVNSSDVAAVAPGAPRSLTATASGTTTINLSWTAPVDNGGSVITGYKIEVSTDSGTTWTDQVANTASTTTTYEHTGLAASTTRDYRVSAINSIGTGLPSDVDSATTGTAANNAPTASNGTVTTNEDTDYAFAAANFNFADTDSGDSLSSVKIVTLPAGGQGTLTLNTTNVSATAAVTKAQLDSGNFKYTPPANANGTGYASFTFKVNDGTVDSSSAYTMTINVTAVNDAPTVATAIPDQTATAGTAFRYQVPTTTFSDADTGDTLSYAATQADGTTLPTWLVFTDSTRTFAGTPQAADVGIVSVKVTATDTNSGTVSNEFDITVSAAPATVTTVSLVSNLGQTEAAGLPLISFDAIQGFETGAGSYTLTSVQLRLQRLTVGTVFTTPSVKLMQGTTSGTSVTLTGQPVTLTAEDTNVTSTTGANHTFTAPASTTLTASTRYFVVVESAGGNVRWLTTALPGEDATPAMGWSIDNNRARRSASSTGAFTTRGRAQLLSINGTTTTPPANAAPTVANPIPDQTATADTEFSYEVPANTFNDVDTGDTLSYAATKGDGTNLPTWLSFDAATRTFTGTPTASDVETVAVEVTANDSNGGTVSDEFNIEVSAATTAASLVSNLGQTQHSGSLPLNSWDVVQGFETGASRYTLVSVDLRLNRQSGGMSIGVPSVKLMGGTKTATSVTLTGQPVTLTAEVAEVTSTTGENYTFTAPSGTTLSASTRYFVVAERVGTRVQWMTTASTGEDAPPASAAGWSIDDERWRRNASNTGNFTNKVDRSQLLRVNGNTNTSTNAAPTLANAIPDQAATAGTLFSYQVPDTTFTDTDTGQTLSYMATKADGMALPTWLAFTAGTRTFAGTPTASDVETVSVKVTANDGNGGSVSDDFDIEVSAADTTAPAFESAVVNGTSLVITFNEDLAAAASLANSAFTVKKGSGGTVQTLSGTPSISGKTVTLTLATAVTATDTAVKVTYTKPTTGSANKLVDLSGNETATFTDQSVDNALADSTAPVLATTDPAVLAADGVTLTLTYNEALKAASVPAASTFTVQATPMGGSEATLALAATDPVAVTGSTVVLTLATPAAHDDGSVKVSYTKPTSGSVIEDTNGNDAANLTDQAVANNSTVPRVSIAASHPDTSPAIAPVELKVTRSNVDTDNALDVTIEFTQVDTWYSSTTQTITINSGATSATKTFTSSYTGNTSGDLVATVAGGDDHLPAACSRPTRPRWRTRCRPRARWRRLRTSGPPSRSTRPTPPGSILW